ncbi:hypothetical protein K438DRAFT_1786330 [Mycena galopus ATCC 62051]|nr:hypothetical protein K438DRAFT_1786330 [Mycena galopus ATCC 62051]
MEVAVELEAARSISLGRINQNQKNGWRQDAIANEYLKEQLLKPFNFLKPAEKKKLWAMGRGLIYRRQEAHPSPPEPSTCLEENHNELNSSKKQQPNPLGFELEPVDIVEEEHAERINRIALQLEADRSMEGSSTWRDKTMTARWHDIQCIRQPIAKETSAQFLQTGPGKMSKRTSLEWWWIEVPGVEPGSLANQWIGFTSGQR